ncbi:MAG: SAM-dependent methyltransferase [Betaproteobacteria bacterium]
MNDEAFWSARYENAGDDYLFGVAPNRFLAQHAALFEAGESALSIADGEGRNSVWLAEQGLDVTAAEISPVAVRKARRLADARGVSVHFEIADLLAPVWPPAIAEGAFDWVIGIFIQFVGADDRRQLFAGMQHATAPGGRILLLGYTPAQLEYKTGGPGILENLYTPESLRTEFRGWVMEELVAYEDEVTEGSAHAGRAALIGMVARKPG